MTDEDGHCRDDFFSENAKKQPLSRKLRVRGCPIFAVNGEIYRKPPFFLLITRWINVQRTPIYNSSKLHLVKEAEMLAARGRGLDKSCYIERRGRRTWD